MPERISLDVSATPGSVSTIRRVLGGLALRLGYSLDDLEDLYLGTEEFLRRALDGHAPERLQLDMEVGQDQLELVLGRFTSVDLRAEVLAPVKAYDSFDLSHLLQRTMDEVGVIPHRDGSFHVVLVRRRRSAP